jgi:hypothetical protein
MKLWDSIELYAAWSKSLEQATRPVTAEGLGFRKPKFGHYSRGGHHGMKHVGKWHHLKNHAIKSPTQAVGTSEGAEKGWDTRGRGRKTGEVFNLSHKATGNKVASALRSLGYSRDMSKSNLPGTHYSHPEGHEAYHDNPGFQRNNLRISSSGKDHLADVEQKLQEKGLL